MSLRLSDIARAERAYERNTEADYQNSLECDPVISLDTEIATIMVELTCGHDVDRFSDFIGEWAQANHEQVSDQTAQFMSDILEAYVMYRTEPENLGRAVTRLVTPIVIDVAKRNLGIK